MGGVGVVMIGVVWRGAAVAEIAMVVNGEMRAENQEVQAPFGQRTSVGGFEKVSNVVEEAIATTWEPFIILELSSLHF